MKCITPAALMVVALSASAQAQQNTMVAGVNAVYSQAKGYLMATAQQVPQDKYGFKPTPEVRSVGAILGHVADSNRMFCAMAEGKAQPPENMGSEKLTDKDQIIAALNSAFAYCDGVMAKLTDADLGRKLTMFGQPATVAEVIAENAAHDFEHYGNLVTYMRLNGMVPPSSQPAKN
jgi:uncharacterized damage-inducible protein DinB